MGSFHNRTTLKGFRQTLRNEATPAERTLWRLLKRSGLEGRKFRRQHSVGPYVLDFYCPEERLAIELDGSVHSDPLRATYDAEREAFLTARGTEVLRIENRWVMEQPEATGDWIVNHFERRQNHPPAPSSHEEGEQEHPSR